MTAACFAQEIGHNFGLEPSSSPHFDDPNDPGHSNDPIVNDPDAFDILKNHPYTIIGDTMNNSGGGAFQGADATTFNAFDWEYLRQQIMNLPSTGPSAPSQFTTDVAPAVAGVGNSVYFFAKRSDGRIYYNRAVLGQAGVGWSEVQGNGLTDTAPAAGAVGTHVFVTVKGPDVDLLPRMKSL